MMHLTSVGTAFPLTLHHLTLTKQLLMAPGKRLIHTSEPMLVAEVYWEEDGLAEGGVAHQAEMCLYYHDVQ